MIFSFVFGRQVQDSLILKWKSKEEVANTWKLKDLEDLQGRLALNKENLSDDSSEAITYFERVSYEKEKLVFPLT